MCIYPGVPCGPRVIENRIGAADMGGTGITARAASGGCTLRTARMKFTTARVLNLKR